MHVRISDLRLTVQNNGKEGAQKAGRIGGRAINILVNLGFTGVVVQMVFLHQI